MHFFSNTLLRKIVLIFRFCYYLLCRCEITTLISISGGLEFFPSKGGKDAVYEKRNGRRDVHFPQELAFFLYNMIKVLFPICALNWRVNIYGFCQGKCINRRNGSTNIFYKLQPFGIVLKFDIINCLFLLKLFPHNKGDHFLLQNQKLIWYLQLTELLPQNHGNIEE